MEGSAVRLKNRRPFARSRILNGSGVKSWAVRLSGTILHIHLVLVNTQPLALRDDFPPTGSAYCPVAVILLSALLAASRRKLFQLPVALPAHGSP